MRTIKFRAKRLDNKEWTCGYFYEENDNTYIIENRQKESILNRNITYMVDPKTVCQFTGLHDKNGKEIYEGDVLRSDEYPYSNLRYEECDNYFAVLYYCNNATSFLIQKIKNPKSSIGGLSDDFSDYITQREISYFEVIGNIHEDEWKQYRKYFPN